MATLTEISVMSRKLIFWIIGVVALLIFLRILFAVFVNYYKATHPRKTPPPNMLFGKLPNPKFPNTMVTSSGYSFVLQTIEGKPPDATMAAKVYFMPKKLPSLLAPQKAREVAKKFNFTADPQVLTSTQYRFTDSETDRVLDLDIVNLNFQYTYNYSTNQEIFQKTVTDNADQIIGQLQSFSSGQIDPIFFNDQANVTYLLYESSTKSFNPVTKRVNANSSRIDLFRNNVDGYALLPPGFSKSYTYALTSSSSDMMKKYLKISYFFWPISFDNFGTYPLRTATQAWEEFNSGNGVIAQLGENQKNKPIIVRKIYLAYYDSGLSENYLEPIFVFEGDNNFAGYVPAISVDWLE